MKTIKMYKKNLLLGGGLLLSSILAYSQESKSSNNDPKPSVLIADQYKAGTYFIYNGDDWVGEITGSQGNHKDITINSKRESQWLRINANKAAITFWTNNGAFTDDNPNFIFSEKGYLGIGITAPTAPLHVKGNSFFDNGNLGIGTSSPSYKVHIKNDGWGLLHEQNDSKINIATYVDSKGGWIGTKSNNDLILFSNNNNDYSKQLILTKGGKTVIGSDPSKISTSNLSNYNLFVANGVLTEKYGLAPVNSWADYVFSDTYQLKGLSKVESYIKMNKRLPNIPSADEIAKEGYSLHDMNVKFLEKIEELTLYAIDQEKQLKKLESQLEEYKLLAEQVQQLKDKMLKNR